MKTLNQIAIAAATGADTADFDELVTRCRPMLVSHLRRIGFRSAILDADDLHQLALMAVREALSTWNPDLSGFGSFAGRVIRCRLLSAIKHRGSRGAVSIDTPTPDGDTIAGYIPDPRPDPSTIAEQRDAANYILATLSHQDRRIIESIAAGDSYAAIGQSLGVSAKAIDNHVQRIRRHARALREAA